MATTSWSTPSTTRARSTRTRSAPSPRRARLAGELGGEAHAVVVGGDDSPTTCAGSLGAYGAAKVFRAKGPEGLAQPVVDAMAKVMDDGGHRYALFGGGLLGFEIGAGLAARLDAGVTMEVTAVRVEDGELARRAPDPRRLVDLRRRATATSGSSSAA